ncbi:MAG: PD-(D/E)XK nuclease family protein [Clostridia bacterium]|nr:PD-(D/E)XK nuclease family protein [Clostridia bacterium]
MLNLILTDALVSEPITDALASRYGSGGNHLVIVPDRFTLSYERAILRRLKLKGAFDIEVASFSRLADVALEEGHKGALNSLSEVMLLRKVIEENRSQLKCFRSSAAFSGFCSEFYAALSQIRASGVSSEQLQTILPSLSGKAAIKTHDIALLYGKYIEGLGSLQDNAGKLEYLRDVIAQGRYSGYHVYVSDFTGFTKAELDIVDALVSSSLSVTVCMPYCASSGAARIYPISDIERIKAMARSRGIETHIENISYLKGDFALLRDNLFSYSGNKATSDGSIELLKCVDVESELRCVARRIKERVVCGGARYRDFAVVCCDSSRYRGVADKVFDDFSLPRYFDAKTPLASTAAARLMMCGMRAVLKNYRMREMIELAKCELTGISYSDADAFENYIIKYYIDYAAFSKPFVIEDEYVSSAERVRSRLMGALGALKPLSGEGSAAVFGDCIKKYFDYLSFNNALQRLCLKQIEQGLISDAAVGAQCSDKLSAIIGECSAVFGDCVLGGALYYEVIRCAVDAQQISTVPLSLDCVFIGQAGESRYEDCKHMFVVGAQAGKLPVEYGDFGMVTGRDCELWRKFDVDVGPDAAARNRAAKLDALMTLVKPSRTLTVSYCSAAGGDSPSAAIREISSIFSLQVVTVADSPQEAEDKDALARYLGGAGNAKGALAAFARLMREGVALLPRERMDELYSYVCSVYSRGYTDMLVRGEDFLRSPLEGVGALRFGVTSVSRLEKYMKCPFMHYVDYVLKVKEREEARLNVRDLGTLTHTVMEKFFGEHYRAEISDKEIEDCVRGIMDEVLSKPQFSYLYNMPTLANEIKSITDRCIFSLKILCAKMKKSLFMPYALERGFGEGDYYPPVVVDTDSGRLSLRGKIDRIDRWGDRIAVIDYKSASKVEFKPKDIVFGHRIQTYIYLAAALSESGVKPAGVFYLPFGGGYGDESKDGDRLRYSGFITSDIDVLRAFDAGAVEELSKSELYPFRVKSVKEGKVKVEGNSGFAVEDSILYAFCDYARKISGVAAGEIASGYIAPSPTGKACEYCKYGALCNKGDAVLRDTGRYELADCKGGERGLE